MVYTFRAETAEAARRVRAIAFDRARTIDIWQDDDAWWLKVWTEDRELPRKVRPYASLERREW